MGDFGYDIKLSYHRNFLWRSAPMRATLQSVESWRQAMWITLSLNIIEKQTFFFNFL